MFTQRRRAELPLHPLVVVTVQAAVMSVFSTILAVFAMDLELEAFLSSRFLALWQENPKQAAEGVMLILLSALISYHSIRPFSAMAVISCLYSKHGKLANTILKQKPIPKNITDQIIVPLRWHIIRALSLVTASTGILSAIIALIAALSASTGVTAIVSFCVTLATGITTVIAGVTALGVVWLGHQALAVSEL